MSKSNREVIRLYAAGTRASYWTRRNHVGFDGPILYSYGHHYPLAVRLLTPLMHEPAVQIGDASRVSPRLDLSRQTYLVNDEQWSVTTAHHRSEAISELLRTDAEVFSLPLNALRNSTGIRFADLQLVDRTAGGTVFYCRRCKQELPYSDWPEREFTHADGSPLCLPKRLQLMDGQREIFRQGEVGFPSVDRSRIRQCLYRVVYYNGEALLTDGRRMVLYSSTRTAPTPTMQLLPTSRERHVGSIVAARGLLRAPEAA